MRPARVRHSPTTACRLVRHPVPSRAGAPGRPRRQRDPARGLEAEHRARSSSRQTPSSSLPGVRPAARRRRRRKEDAWSKRGGPPGPAHRCRPHVVQGRSSRAACSWPPRMYAASAAKGAPRSPPRLRWRHGPCARRGVSRRSRAALAPATRRSELPPPPTSRSGARSRVSSWRRPPDASASSWGQDARAPGADARGARHRRRRDGPATCRRRPSIGWREDPCPRARRWPRCRPAGRARVAPVVPRGR